MMRAGLCMCAAAIQSVVPGVGVVRGRALLVDVPDGQGGDGLPQRLIRGEDSVVAVPVLCRATRASL
jgi:hypothetical protein